MINFFQHCPRDLQAHFASDAGVSRAELAVGYQKPGKRQAQKTGYERAEKNAPACASRSLPCPSGCSPA